MAAAQVTWCSDDDELDPAMFVEPQLETPDAEYLDRGKLLENLLTISQSGMPVIQERTEYPCPMCRGSFQSLGDLVMHECPNEKPAQPVLTCVFCTFATNEGDLFRSHLKLLHFKPSLRCGHCNHTFPSEEVMVRHLQLHGSSLPMQPLLGLESGAQLTTFLTAQMTPVLATSNNGTLCIVNAPTYVVPALEDCHTRNTCSLCSETFPRLSQLAAHGLKHPEFPDIHIQGNCLLPGRGSQEPLGALMCSQCCVVFTHPVALAAHSCNSKESSDGGGDGVVPPPSLAGGTTFLVPQGSPGGDLGAPQLPLVLPGGTPQQQSPVRLYCCPYCPYTSYLLASLIRHKEMHADAVAGTASLPVILPAQGVNNSNGPYKRGRPRKNQEQIEVTKVGRVWHCKTCGVTLRRGSDEAASHKCNMFQCPHCSFMTHKPNGLNIHISFAHSFRCTRCGNTFVSKEERTLHSTYLCANRPFKSISEEDIPLAVLKRHRERNSISNDEHKSEQEAGPEQPQPERQPEPQPAAGEPVAAPPRRGRPPKNRLLLALPATPQTSQAEPKNETRKRGRPRGRRK
ncbi:uncharacterized protein LOC144178717 isoform X2 [Haemaphysalis longicornis]